MLDVLHITSSLDPRHGGPSRTVPALAAAQLAAGAYVQLATVGPVPPGFVARFPGLPVHAFSARPGPLGAALACATGMESFLRRTPARAIHVHGVWLRPLHYAALAAAHQRIPLIIAPRGMLEPWARAHHAWKKRLAAAFVHPRAFAAAAGWHATSQQEADHLRALFAAPVCVAPNGVAEPAPAHSAPARAAWLAAYPELHDTRVALFYGRLHAKKRVAELISLWRSRPRPGWTLLVAGIPEGHTIAELASLATAGVVPRASAPVVVADGRALPAPYPLAELFLLPSHSENFGQAVAEALVAGVPVLVTDTLPWRELNVVGAGRSVAWADYPAALDELLAQPREQLLAAGSAGRTWVSREFTWAAAARRLLDFYPTLAP
ncbi:MAG: glycosyltransferase [Opitutaceae bacterium]|jgi:glycosyltransferase involved in cell wall biosynthesis|nr:glycosyltransferase [Opitutaceae bacterium]